MKTKGLLLTLLLLFCSTVFCQETNTNLQSEFGASSKIYKRRVLSPKIFPYLPFLNQQLNIDDEKIDILDDRGGMIGARWETYFPNHNRGWAIEGDFQNRTYILAPENQFFFSENAIAITPTYLFKQKKGIESTNHRFFEVGIRYQWVLDNEIEFIEKGRYIETFDSPIIKEHRLWGYLGLGIKRDIFNQFANRTGLTNLSLGIYFSLFNQADNFSNKTKSEYSPDLEVFNKNSTRNFNFTLSYTHQLDSKKNIISNYSTDAKDYEFFQNKEQQFLPPLAHFNQPNKKLSGNFFLDFVYQPRLDSIFLESSLGSDIVTITPSTSYRVGYTIVYKLIGDYAPLYVSQDNSKKSALGNVILKFGLHNKQYLLESTQNPARLNFLNFELAGGFQFGFYPFGLNITAGYGRILHLNKKLFYQFQTFDNFNLSNLQKQFIFAGIGIRNSVYLKGSFFLLDSRKIRPTPFDNLFEISIGFGI